MVGFQNDIERCLEVLSAGGLILYPTDTIWGIGCDGTNSNAIEIIYKLKNRHDKKAMIILVPGENEIFNYVTHPPKKIFEHLKTITKPTTVIYNAAKNLPSNLISDDGSIAIRIVKDEFCQSLLHLFKKPIVSTSANISGALSPKKFTEVIDEIKSGVDYIVQHRQDDLKSYESSSIIKLNSKEEIEIIR